MEISKDSQKMTIKPMRDGSLPQSKCLLSYCFIVSVCFYEIYSAHTTLEMIQKHKEWLRDHSLRNGNVRNNFAENIPRLHHPTLSPKDVLFNQNSTFEITAMSITTQSANTTADIDADRMVLPPLPLPNLEPPTQNASNSFRHRKYPRWSVWGPWSTCSRTCGDGVRWQRRKCLNRDSVTGKRYRSYECYGASKRYQLCQQNQCLYDNDKFREIQCSFFNELDFHGQRYVWEPYIKDDAECELNCKPLGSKYFATLNKTVVDGTPCSRPAEFYRFHYRGSAICIEGICKALQNNGYIMGSSVNSGSVSCGGLLCRPFTGIFTRSPLPDDAYVHIAFLPSGASNISITELQSSANLLVLRTEDQRYVFNGDNTISDSGTYEVAGAVFDYHRIDSGFQENSTDGVTEWITAVGPILESLELMMYNRLENPGVKYEYLLPISSESDENEIFLENEGLLKSSGSEIRRHRPFRWKVISFTMCSKSCGGGFQTPVIRCVRESPLRFYSHKRCVHLEKPIINENLLRCNTQPCPAYWRLHDWSECNCDQTDEESGYRERDVSCVQELATGIVIHVDDSACMEEQPKNRKRCDCGKNRRNSYPSISRYRMHGIIPNMSISHIHQPRDKAGIWLMSDWNQYCSSECGLGVEYRTIFCDRSKSNMERCDLRSTPEIARPCENDRPCDRGKWFAGPWSVCDGNCYNLTRIRTILCIQNQLIVEDDECPLELKPQAVDKCLHAEVDYCGPRWHYSEWSECSKLCDGGIQRRTVKCLQYDEKENILKESMKCRYSLREPIYRSCNTSPCNNGLQYNDIEEEKVTNKVIINCVDKYANCSWAVKAKLCVYDYYQKHCCYSCNLSQ